MKEDDITDLAKKKGFTDSLLTDLKRLFYLAEVQKWLREWCGLYVQVQLNERTYGIEEVFNVIVISISKQNYEFDSEYPYDIYEDALEEGIKQALLLLPDLK